MQAVATYPPLGVVGLIDDLLRRARGWLEARDDARIAKEKRLRAILDLRDTVVDETRAGCRDLAPDDVPAALLDLGRRHWRLWGAAMRCAMDLEQLMTGASSLLRTSALAWSELAAEAHVVLPLLPSNARRDVRAAAKLLASFTELALAVARKSGDPLQVEVDAVSAMFDTPTEQVPTELLSLNAALEVLFVGGHMGGVSESVTRAAAAWLWEDLARPLRGTTWAHLLEEARRCAADAEAAHASARAASPEREAARERAHADLTRGYEELRRDPDAWTSYLRVRSEWEATLGDGLGDPGKQ
jgi:hypothetical protein